MVLRNCLNIVLLVLLCMNLQAQDGYVPVQDHDSLLIVRRALLEEIENSYRDYPDSLWYIGRKYAKVQKASVGTPFFYDDRNLEGSV